MSDGSGGACQIPHKGHQHVSGWQALERFRRMDTCQIAELGDGVECQTTTRLRY